MVNNHLTFKVEPKNKGGTITPVAIPCIGLAIFSNLIGPCCC